MFINEHIGLKNYTKFFAESLGEIILESILIVFTERFTLYELNSVVIILISMIVNHGFNDLM